MTESIKSSWLFVAAVAVTVIAGLLWPKVSLAQEALSLDCADALTTPVAYAPVGGNIGIGTKRPCLPKVIAEGPEATLKQANAEVLTPPAKAPAAATHRFVRMSTTQPVKLQQAFQPKPLDLEAAGKAYASADETTQPWALYASLLGGVGNGAVLGGGVGLAHPLTQNLGLMGSLDYWHSSGNGGRNTAALDLGLGYTFAPRWLAFAMAGPGYGFGGDDPDRLGLATAVGVGYSLGDGYTLSGQVGGFFSANQPEWTFMARLNKVLFAFQ